MSILIHITLINEHLYRMRSRRTNKQKEKKEKETTGAMKPKRKLNKEQKSMKEMSNKKKKRKYDYLTNVLTFQMVEDAEKTLKFWKCFYSCVFVVLQAQLL